MFLRKIAAWLIKNLLVLLLITFIFSAAALDLPGMVKWLFKDIFSYSSPEAQKVVVSKLTSACSLLDATGASDAPGLQQMPGMPFDLSKIGSLCKEYNNGSIDDKGFFFNVIGSAIPGKLELPKAKALERYNSALGFLNKNKIYYIIAILALLAILYLLAGNLSAFLMDLGGISFIIGILILLPYAAIMAYGELVGFDTTPILSSILQGSLSFDANAIASVVLLMILRTYTGFIVTLGFVFLGTGIAGKVYIRRLKNQGLKAGVKTDKKPEKAATTKKEKQTKEDADEAYKHRDRSAKEILEELEEMHRKKMKDKEREN